MPNGLSILKIKWWLLTAIAVGVIGAYFLFRWWQGPLVPIETVIRRDFVQTVVASGHVESPHRVDVGAQITATVMRVPVNDGQMVQAKDLLVELASEELKAAEMQANSAVAQADAKLRQLKEVQTPVAEQTQRQAQVNLDNAKAALKRNEDLFNKNFIGQAALDDSRKAVELSDAQLRSAQKQLESTRASGSDYAVAQTAVIQAKASAEAARARSRYAQIRAPVDGVLIGRNVEVGDVVQPGKVLMTLSPQGRIQLVVAIDEKNLPLIALGQKALVSADAYPQQKFPAELVYINPGINAQTGAVDVKLDVPNPPAYLRQDMTVSIDIEVAKRPGALLVSVASIHEADSAAPWVLRVDNGHVGKVPVRLGLRSGGIAEVIEGLREDDAIVSGAGLNAHPGARVRTQLQPQK